MMTAYWLPNGNLLVPMPAYTDDPSFHGDGLMEVEPGSALFAEWEVEAIVDDALTAAGGFNPSQARVPKGNQNGGRWVGTAGELADGLAGKMGGVQDVVRNQGGASLDPVTLQQPTTGYMVARPGFNQEIPEADFFGPGGEDLLYAWIEKNQAALSEEGSHIGLWHDTKNGEVTLDVSQNVEDLDEAIRLGEERNQQSIWDIVGNDEIDTGGTGDRQPDDKLVASGRAAERRAAGGLSGLARRAEAGVRSRGDRGSEAGKLAAGLTAAGGNPEQARVPKGNDAGGQWVQTVSGVLESLGVSYGGGHGPDADLMAEQLGAPGDPVALTAMQKDPKGYQNRINPRHAEDPANCQRCVYATELQARGFGASAAYATGNESDVFHADITERLDLSGTYDPAYGEGRQWTLPERNMTQAVNAGRIPSDPPGSRYFLQVTNKRTGGGHILNAEKDANGKMVIFDGQSGNTKFRTTEYTNLQFIRVDDLPLDSLIFEAANGNPPWVVREGEAE